MTRENQDAIVVHNYYWARPGKVDEVYRHRLYASKVRATLGLPTGRVLRRTGASDELPDVIWECEYPSLAARQRDLQALTDSGVFDAVMAHMRTLTRKFDRGMWTISGS